jgi:hypothetical protein
MAIRQWYRSTTFLSGIVGGVFLSTIHASAADIYSPAPYTKAPASIFAPAVDGFNVKADAFGGSYSHQSIGGVRGSFSTPVTPSTGLQIDLQGGAHGGDPFAAVSGHLFWRDPNRALFGLYASYTHLDRFGGANVGQVAAEGEYYWGRWTLQGIAGVEFGNTTGDTSSTSSTIPQNFIFPGVTTVNTFTEGYDIRTRFFDQINLKYYLTDNWDAYVGHRYLGGKHAFAVGSEYAMPLGNRTLGSAFAEARVGSGDFQGVWGGLRVYLGQKDKTLIQRHRQDDPIVWDTLFSILNSHTTSAGSSRRQFCTNGQLINGFCEGGID